MPRLIELDRFTSVFFEILDETFENVQGSYLDKGTSLFETLDTITAEVASRPVSKECATIAAQVEHVRFYLDQIENNILGKDVGPVDWGEIWRTTRAVTPAQWESSKARLKKSHQRVVKLMHNLDNWEGEEDFSGALAILVHTAYHLGEIRQALCTVKGA